MKHLLIFTIALATSLCAYSQKTHKVMGWKITKDLPQNEVKLNLASSIFSSYPEISYERILNTDISVGVATGISLEDDNYPVDFSIIPYFRWFFGGNTKSLQKHGAGFFIEANGAIVSVKEYIYDSGYGNPDTQTKAGAGLGLAIGWKYLSHDNWVGEIHVGAGRHTVDNGNYPRIGITIGKRF